MEYFYRSLRLAPHCHIAYANTRDEDCPIYASDARERRAFPALPWLISDIYSQSILGAVLHMYDVEAAHAYGVSKG